MAVFNITAGLICEDRVAVIYQGYIYVCYVFNGPTDCLGKGGFRGGRTGRAPPPKIFPNTIFL